MTFRWTVVAALVLAAGVAHAGDAAQFRGPNRDGRFDEQGLMKAWPENGPPVAWVVKGLGEGFSSASVVQGKVYVTGMAENEDAFLFVINTDGVVEKKIAYGKESTNKEARGPRSTPTIDNGRAYFVSGLGVLYCIDIEQGKTVWAVNLFERFGAENIMWHLAESVLVDGDRVICTPGGKDAVFAALDKATGNTIWTTAGVDDNTSYCSAALAAHGGRRLLLNNTAKYVVGADADTGALLWTFPHKTPWGIHAVTPLYKDGLVYYVGGEKAGGGVLELSPDGTSVTSKWASLDLDCLHYGVVLDNGYLYGTGEKNDYLMCVEMATGKVAWSAKEVGQGATVYADGMLYVYEGPKAGIVDLVKADPAGFQRTGSCTVTEGNGKHWAHPTIANGRLYIRHGDALVAYNISGV